MSQLFPFIKVFLLLTLTGLSLFRIAPRAIREIHSWTDRIILSFLTGVAFYTLFFLLAQGLLNLPLNTLSLGIVFALVVAGGTGTEIYRRTQNQKGGFEESEDVDPMEGRVDKKILRDVLILLGLGLVFFFSLHIRMENGLKYPNKLLDADPYRHHIRTEALLETGHLSKYDPYLVGEVPIFELQGCYILAGVLGVAGPFSAWQIWAWGSQVFGALSIVSLYLFTKLSLRSVLQQDLGPPPRPKKGKPVSHLHADNVASFLGLIAAALWGASPVHILRTNAGFSEAFAIPLLAPTLLFYLWAAQSRIWGDFVWFGIFFTALAFINPVPAVFIVPFFMVHSIYVMVKTKDLRWLKGTCLAGAIFFVCLMVWNWKFLATPLLTGAKATGEAGTSGLVKSMGPNVSLKDKLNAGWDTFSREIFKNLGFLNISGPWSRKFFGLIGAVGAGAQKFFDGLTVMVGFFGSCWILWDRREKNWRVNETTMFFFLSYAFFFLILFAIPFGFISFTSKYYRYLLPISLSLSVLCAYFAWRVVLWFFRKDLGKVWGLSLALLIAFVINLDGRTWGGWVLNCTPEEYSAADWINKNAPPDAFLIANWYTGDYLRSLTQRKVIISDYPRSEVKVAMDRFKLNIPILPKDPAKVAEYVRQNPGTYYLVTAKWGPWGAYDKDPHFQLLNTFGTEPKTMSRIFKVSSEVSSESQPTSLPTSK